jgi:vancomycin resistance protein YoaR
MSPGISRINRLFVIIAAVFLLLVLASFAVTLALDSSKNIHKGIYIEDVNVSGMTENQAYDEVERNIQSKYEGTMLELKGNEYIHKVSLNQTGCMFMIQEAVRRAYLTGREGNIASRISSIFQAKLKKKNIDVNLVCSTENIRGILMGIKNNVDKESRNASIEVNEGELEYMSDETGYILDIEKNILIITEQLLQKRFEPVNLDIEEIAPEIKFDDICHIKDQLSSFKTWFNSENLNRSHNIKLACERLNNLILMPKAIMSVDRTLGPRTKEAGYLDAPIIYNNELVPGLGGGICQVTTTLYGAVLRAGLDVLERTPHSMPLAYVQPGQDATIAENSIDFKFQNNLDYAIYINAEVVSGNIVMTIYGVKHDKNYIIIKSDIIEVYHPPEQEIIIDDSLQDGEIKVLQQPRDGYRTVVWKETYDEIGNLLKREKISDDKYRAVTGRIKVSADFGREDTDGEQEDTNEEGEDTRENIETNGF